MTIPYSEKRIRELAKDNNMQVRAFLVDNEWKFHRYDYPTIELLAGTTPILIFEKKTSVNAFVPVLERSLQHEQAKSIIQQANEDCQKIDISGMREDQQAHQKKWQSLSYRMAVAIQSAEIALGAYHNAQKQITKGNLWYIDEFYCHVEMALKAGALWRMLDEEVSKAISPRQGGGWVINEAVDAHPEVESQVPPDYEEMA